jgi:hypothetical protein
MFPDVPDAEPKFLSLSKRESMRLVFRLEMNSPYRIVINCFNKSRSFFYVWKITQYEK